MPDTDVIEQINQEIIVKVPSMYKVLLHNDDRTTMDFVIEVLRVIFHRTAEESVAIMLAIHETGQGVAGSPYTHEVAEEKTKETLKVARANGFPLIATFEEI